MTAPNKTSPENDPACQVRWQRIMDCVRLKQPDRMPTVFQPHCWLAKYGDITYKQLMHDYGVIYELSERAVLEFDPDACLPIMSFVGWGRAAEAIGMKALNWPGHGVDDDRPFQYLDKEYMVSEEYDEFLFDPTRFYLAKYLPRVTEAFEGMAGLAPFAGLTGLKVLAAVRSFANQEVRKAVACIINASDEVDQYFRHCVEFNKHIEALGYPLITMTHANGPYDAVADYMRGATGMMKDMYRNKEKLLAAIDKIYPYIEKQILDGARASGNPIVMLTTNWAPDAFMSQKQFGFFWWPSFRRLMLSLIANNLIPMVLWEHDCTKRLEIIKDVPPGKCIYWFERTDMVRAFEVLGDVVALRGGLSTSLMVTSTPDQVDDAVRSLVEKVWNRGGKLILDVGTPLPEETPTENVRAMFRAARKYAG